MKHVVGAGLRNLPASTGDLTKTFFEIDAIPIRTACLTADCSANVFLPPTLLNFVF
jgi:hypothetical protein